MTHPVSASANRAAARRAVSAASLVALVLWGCGRPTEPTAGPLESRDIAARVESLEDQDITRTGESGETGETGEREAVTAASEQVVPERAIPDEIAWVGIGATAGPSLTQLSIEDELLEVERKFGPGRGLLYFAGGPGTRGIQTSGRDGAYKNDELLQNLGDLFGAVTDRRTHYRALRLNPHGPATDEAIKAGLAHALGESNRPLLLWLAGHGAEVDDLADAEVGTWGGGALTRSDLEVLLTASQRPVRFIGTQCYGAGFAEALMSLQDACGAFAAVWTLPASGCDPSPDAARTSYGTHLLALLETARDLDGNGRIGLSEAHVAAVLKVEGIDVPVLSSQHLLYNLVEEPAEISPSADDGLFEEHALLAALEETLGVKASDLTARMVEVHEAYELAAQADDEAADRESEATVAARASVLARWPELEDPWHPDFMVTLEHDRKAIAEHFLRDQVLDAWLVATEKRAGTLDDFAQTERLLRALARFEVALGTMRRAAFAREREPGTYELFMRLRACERAPLFAERTP